ncbi:PIN2/TERF1-interacting telomerase inhibitor 1 [Paramormyrops kingsleyae]|uniref:PIN2 (TERF1) interacting telomerase inhibitor 1 n=1 Tax=Paramormyrops kingsleyae TaxID=1676925 RepID=A0A3B3RL33_9TELE|nr:PIN2/TERF1-interacting telomerase inhibitor 1 [Paramormyrops kingsleyae]
MAMLSEPRRKQKWSVDPRNSTWSKDESKFGQKMLEKMGWSKGKGLGRTEQGATEHIKVKVKNNTLGLGTTASYEDNWIAHQDDFNQILADLNSCHSQNESTAEPKQSFSLEEKSKTSKKRVHYMKFTKGKDLSSRSQTDLACVFGKRTKPSEEKVEQNDHQEDVPADEEAVTSDPEVNNTINTVTSSLTMQEYFAQRMAGLKEGRRETPTPKAADGPPEGSLDPPKGRKPSSKKKKKDRGEKETESHETEECGNQGRKKKKKQRRRADREDGEEVITEDCTTTGGLGQQEVRDQDGAETYRCRKSKKRKLGQTVEERDVETVLSEAQNGTDDARSIEKRKRRMAKEQVLQVTEVKKSKKKKNQEH